ncbi:MMtag domain-containing protein [Cephalotus follicularis]|uniref:MMtag domain-containing protein n=1 Tax=Cephalotus follicularis TaxID=3775 RepID=A0A1Q3C9A2_CEPFO|nr:MMtag domain-containing protein [Cephalotus follicularis]
MYHPTRGGVRGGRDQFSWDDVKVDKHRENYLGHSIKAPVGRWQKGKDLHWYTRDKKSESSDAVKEEIQRIKEQEEQAMREALGLAPKRSSQPQGNRLDKHELSELVKRGSTAEDLGEGHSEAAWVHGIGFSRAPRPWEEPSTLKSSQKEVSPETVKVALPPPSTKNSKEDQLEDESSQKRRKREEKKHAKHEKHEQREKHHSRDSDDKRKYRKDKERRRHDSD